MCCQCWLPINPWQSESERSLSCVKYAPFAFAYWGNGDIYAINALRGEIHMKLSNKHWMKSSACSPLLTHRSGCLTQQTDTRLRSSFLKWRISECRVECWRVRKGVDDDCSCETAPSCVKLKLLASVWRRRSFDQTTLKKDYTFEMHYPKSQSRQFLVLHTDFSVMHFSL